MIEPSTPTTIRIAHSSYPAFLLANDDDVKFKASSAFIRYRHLRQYQRVIRGSMVASMSTSNGAPKITPGVVVNAGISPLADTSKPSVASTHGPAPLIATPATVLTVRVPVNAGVPAGPSGGLVVTPCPTLIDKPSPSGGESQGALPSSTSVTASPPQHAPLNLVNSAVPHGGSGSISATSGTLVIPRPSGAAYDILRHEHAIRSHQEKIVWFSSVGDTPLSEPVPIPVSHFGDLYVHSVAETSLQVWLRSDRGAWCPVDMFHPHPYLHGHVLHILPSREPRWVTKDTVRTYKARAKRVRDVSVFSESAENA